MNARQTFATVLTERKRSPRPALYPTIDMREVPFQLHAIECRAGWDCYRWLPLATGTLTAFWVVFSLTVSLWLLTWIPK